MTHFLDAILEPVLWFAADWSLRWAALIGVAALAILLIRPRRAATRQLLCWVALFGGLLLPVLPRWGGGWQPAPKETTTPPFSFPSSVWERRPRNSVSRLLSSPRLNPNR